VVSYADSLDCVGIMANEIHAVRTVFGTLRFNMTANPMLIPAQTSSRILIQPTMRPVHRRHRENQRARRRSHHFVSGSQSYVLPSTFLINTKETSATPPSRALLAHLRSLGISIQAVSIPSTAHALAAYYTIASAEASSSLARFGGGWWGRERELFGREVRKRILAGTWALTAE
jgi:aspartyl-tRNA(Asn)/glutamyl-tRNA(Gln) amidotransferase subunit A